MNESIDIHYFLTVGTFLFICGGSFISHNGRLAFNQSLSSVGELCLFFSFVTFKELTDQQCNNRALRDKVVTLNSVKAPRAGLTDNLNIDHKF